ncbi:MAG: hypothetical protein WBL63_22965 [Candidatus Acidiferrum sp.]
MRDLLAKSKANPGVELAKEIHKRCGWPQSEALLVDAFSLYDYLQALLCSYSCYSFRSIWPLPESA